MAVSRNLGFSDVLSAEAQALRHGLMKLSESSNQAVIIEGDSKILLDVLTGKAQCPWRIKFLVQDIPL